MSNRGTVEPAGTIGGALSPIGELTGTLQQVQSINGELTAPTERIVPGDYDKLSNKPSINEVELKNNKSFEDLGDHTLSNIEIKRIFDRVFKGE